MLALPEHDGWGDSSTGDGGGNGYGSGGPEYASGLTGEHGCGDIGFTDGEGTGYGDGFHGGDGVSRAVHSRE